MKTVGIYPSPDNDIDFLGTSMVMAKLKACRIIMPEEYEGRFNPREAVEFVNKSKFFSEPDVIIVLGGDGTILRAARNCALAGVPIIGINLGRIGYMAELELDELSMLDRLFSGDFQIEKRMLIEVEVGGEKLFALNEAVLGGDSVFRIVEIELWCENNKVNRYRADGLIAATPTGSTAYSMSAGGSVVDPRLEAIMITPICSHSLNATPLLFSAESELTMKNVTSRAEKLYLNLDGCEIRELAYGESAKIRRSDKTVSFIRLKDGTFYDVLQRKMADIH